MTATPDGKQSFASSVMSGVLARRGHDNRYRAEVARGRSAGTERYAYPHLAWAWQDGDWRRVPILRVAAMACDFPSIADNPNQSFFTAVRSLCHTDNETESVGRRLAAAYAMPAEQALYVWRSFAARLEHDHIAFSWARLLSTALAWEHPDPDIRDRVRRRTLEDFHTRRQPTPQTPDTSADTGDNPDTRSPR